MTRVFTYVECVYKGVTYSSGTEWASPDDPCTHFKCLAGVITESNLQCYTPCASPQLAGPGQCCPTCAGESYLFFYLSVKRLISHNL